MNGVGFGTLAGTLVVYDCGVDRGRRKLEVPGSCEEKWGSRAAKWSQSDRNALSRTG